MEINTNNESIYEVANNNNINLKEIEIAIFTLKIKSFNEYTNKYTHLHNLSEEEKNIIKKMINNYEYIKKRIINGEKLIPKINEVKETSINIYYDIFKQNIEIQKNKNFKPILITENYKKNMEI